MPSSFSSVNILPWGSTWYAPLWLAQVFFFFFVFDLASYHHYQELGSISARVLANQSVRACELGYLLLLGVSGTMV